MKYSIYMFAIIGFLSSIFIVATFFLKAEPVERCISDGSVIHLDSYYNEDTGFHYELIAHTTGFSDKVIFLKLLKGKYNTSSVNCIEHEKVIFSEDIFFGPEHEPAIQWPKSITVINETVKIEYTEKKGDRRNLANIPIVWNSET